MADKKRNGEARSKAMRSDGADAFVPEPELHRPVRDDFAEIVAEAYVESATSGEERGEEVLNEFVVEELGGPFVEDRLLDEYPTDSGEPVTS